MRCCGSAAKLGVDKALRDVDEIDFQGKMLLTAVRKPAMAGGFSLLWIALLVCKPLKSPMPT